MRLSIQRADTVWTRLKGWLGRREINATEALWLSPCRAVHTVGMHVPIDVVFLDARGAVIRVVPALRPRRIAVCWRAASVLELAAGATHQPDARARIECAMRAFTARPD